MTLALGSLALIHGDAEASTATCSLETAPNGLQWCDVVVGSGPAPKVGALIKAHYSGRLAKNNVVFDSSYERGRPLTFTVGVGQVIRGWDIGIAGGDGVPPMQEGGKRQLVIPAELGYGQRGAGGMIAPGDTLIFDVELLPLNGKR